MKIVLAVLLLAILCSLSACGGPTQAPTTEAPTTKEEKPFFTDADIDKAIRLTLGEMKELIGIEAGVVPAGQEIPAQPYNTPELNPRGTVPYTSGFVYYIRHDPNRLLGSPYSIFRHNQLTDASELLYAGEREIQSVAGDHHYGRDCETEVWVVSMRETTDPASDFEIYYFYPCSSPTLYLLTNDIVDNTNVSLSDRHDLVVYEEPVAGKASVVLRSLPYEGVVLSHPNPQRHPSISQDGEYLTFIRDLGNGTDEVVKYSVATNTYASVASSSAVLEYPSISWDGQKVMWLENGSRDSVKLKNLATGTTQSVLSDTFIAHPFLTANGLFMTYQLTRKIVARDLSTGQNAYVTTTPFATMNLYGPLWAQETWGKPILERTPVTSLRPHESLDFGFNAPMFSDSVKRALTLLVNGQVRASELTTRFTFNYVFSPSPPLEFGDVVSWSLSSEARSVDGQRLEPVTGTSVVNLPPNATLNVEISGVPRSSARVSVSGPNGFSSGNLGSSRTLENLIRGTYSISALSFRTNVGRPTCRIYTPDFFSYTATVEYFFTPTVDVIYRSEPCGF